LSLAAFASISSDARCRENIELKQARVRVLERDVGTRESILEVDVRMLAERRIADDGGGIQALARSEHAGADLEPGMLASMAGNFVVPDPAPPDSVTSREANHRGHTPA